MTNHTLQQFHTQAVRHKLSATAILLWQYIYFIASAQGNYANLCLRTLDLTDTLHITRNGLQKVRRTLVNAGLLQVRIDHRQHVYYTLMINGKIVGGNDNDNNKIPVRVDIPHDKPVRTDDKPVRVYDKSVRVDDHIDPQNRADVVIRPYKINTTTNHDIIHNNAYRKLVDAFCAKYTGHDRNTLESALLQFLYRRKERGKTLTKAGLEALLDKLVILAQNNIRIMIDIIYQSLNRGWLGFYPYKPCTATGGYYKPKLARIPKYDTKYEDLDYLEW